MYRRDRQRFAGEPSRFVAWALARVPDWPAPLRVLELGCGPGRDARVWAAAGHRVVAVDHSRVAIERARRRNRATRGIRFVRGEILTYLRRVATASVDVVYAHGVYMGFSERELDELLENVSRVLVPGGRHLFAVRATTDPHFGQGREVAPDVFLGGPHATPMHYYRRETLARFAPIGLVRFAQERRKDVDLWYVGDRREPPTPGRPAKAFLTFDAFAGSWRRGRSSPTKKSVPSRRTKRGSGRSTRSSTRSTTDDRN
jgi:SAM-dependent methyltransferase